MTQMTGPQTWQMQMNSKSVLWVVWQFWW